MTGMEQFMCFLLFLIFIGCFIFVFYSASRTKEKKEQIRMDLANCLSSLNGFENSVFVSDGNTALAIDEINSKIAFARKTNVSNITKSYDFSSIIKAEVLESENVLKHVSKTSSGGITRVIVGGLLLGPAGALIGASTRGYSTTTTEREICKSLVLRVTINDMNNPLYNINFVGYDQLFGYPIKGSTAYDTAKTASLHWLALMEIAMNRGSEAQTSLPS
jgi:hypothetical protein